MSEILSRLQVALANRYAIQRELGRGGMATVYLALDLKHERDVAIKVLHPELAATIGPERFDREIRIAAKLQHPNILGLFDSGEADGLLYYVMPFVYGESLRDRLNKDHMLPLDFAVHVALEVADALGYAHSIGIVHRDIKPENIMISGGHALVADFGIARAASAAGGSAKLTETGMAIGTPLYMSPEQAVGDQVGPTADLYSLGCVLYEMLTGQPPFGGSNARQIMARHAMDAVPSIQVVRDTVPDQVEDAVMAALNKVVADRPQTAAQFAEMLGAPPGATSRYAVSRAQLPRRTLSRISPSGAVTMTIRKRSLVGAVIIGVVAVVLLVGTGVWYLMKPRSSAADTGGGLDPHRIAVLYLDDLSPDHRLGYVTDGLTEALIGALGQVPALKVISQGGVAGWRDPGIARDSVARALDAGTLVQGSVEPVGDKLRVQLRLVDGNSGVDLSGRRASFDLPATELLTVRDSLASEVARLIRQRLGEEIRVRHEREGASNVAAWSLVQQARELRRTGENAANRGDEAGFTRAFAQADSLAESAAQLDPRWPEPLVFRGLLAYRRSYIFGRSDPALAAPWIDSGLAQISRSYTLQPNNADGLEIRGNLRYWRWLLQLERDDAKAKVLLNDARNDLEQATRINPAQAGAWATLSHLYNQTSTGLDVSMAARRALEADAFLDNADKIFQRLFLASYDIGQFTDARHWCDEGVHRFPGNPTLLKCKLWLLTVKTEKPDVPLAWELTDTLLALTPPAERAYDSLYYRTMVAGVIGRAGQADSARRVLARSRGNPTIDPQGDLDFVAAFAYNLSGDKAKAVEHLKAYFAASPGRREAFMEDEGWWFRDLQGYPAYQQLIGSRPAAQ